MVVLEDRAVAGVGVDDELRAGDPSVHVFGECGGDHAVVVAVGDQCRLGDRRQVGGCGAPPAFDRFELGSEGLHGDLRVPILGAFFEAFDECAGGAFADAVAVEEQELLGVLSGEGGTQRVVVGGPGDFVDASPPAGPVPVRISLRTSSGCLITSAWAIIPPREKEKMSTVLKPSAVMKV